MNPSCFLLLVLSLFFHLKVGAFWGGFADPKPKEEPTKEVEVEDGSTHTDVVQVAVDAMKAGLNDKEKLEELKLRLHEKLKQKQKEKEKQTNGKGADSVDGVGVGKGVGRRPSGKMSDMRIKKDFHDRSLWTTEKNDSFIPVPLDFLDMSEGGSRDLAEKVTMIVNKKVTNRLEVGTLLILSKL